MFDTENPSENRNIKTGRGRSLFPLLTLMACSILRKNPQKTWNSRAVSRVIVVDF